MNEGGIFLIQGDRSLVRMTEQAYDSEDVLQTLLEDYPALLAGEQIDRRLPRRWLLVQREAGVPSDGSGGARWSMDHLFLDQDGIPTIVEVKRSTNTQIRREIVGQMLDYAANAVVYWPADRIRAMFEETCRGRGDDPELVVTEFIAPRGEEEPEGEQDIEGFWQEVERNLREHKVRMLFVADAIPPELQRIVEFLNEQLTDAEVLAVEIKQYLGHGVSAMVPRVFGATEEARTTKHVSSGRRKWNLERYMEALEENQGLVAVGVAQRIMGWARERGWEIDWGSGAVSGSLRPNLQAGDRRVVPFCLFTSGRLWIHFAALYNAPPFEQGAKRQELREKLVAIPGLDLPAAADGWPTCSMSPLLERDNLELFLSAFEWVDEEVRAARGI